MATTKTADSDTQKIHNDHACEAAEKFVELYYKTMDKDRFRVSKFYIDAASLVWNGHAVNGQQAIHKFYEGLPSSEHIIESFDSQSISSTITADQTTIIVTCCGHVHYDKNRGKMFNQTFILTSCSPSWKIVSDCIRTT